VGPRKVLKPARYRPAFFPARKMLCVPPGSYCVVSNPVSMADRASGKFEILHGRREHRFHTGRPFPLYPGEVLEKEVTPMTVVAPNQALKIRANEPFVNKSAYLLNC
jgi:major vault protein